MATPKYKQKQRYSESTKKAASLYAHALEGSRKAQHQVAEAIAVGDFVKPLEPILQAQISKVFHETESDVESYTTRKTVSGIDRPEPVQVLVVDTDQSNIPDTNRGDRWIPGTLPSIGPREAYPEIGLTSGYEKSISAGKIGEAGAIDWEAVVNSNGGEVDIIDTFVTSFAKHAKQSQDVRALKRLVKQTGFSDQVVAEATHINGNPDFSDIEKFADALSVFRQTPLQIDGNEITYDSYTLICAPGYEYQYNRMLNARAFRRVPARAGTDAEAPGVEYEFDVTIPVTINVLETKWLRAVYPNIGKGYIMVPNDSDATYPVLTRNFLRGYEEPSFWVKDANARQYRGGDVPVLTQGDFDSDAIKTKVRHVIGSDLLWAKGVLYSDGSNT